MPAALALDFSNMDEPEWPLIARIYADEAYRARYNTYLGEVMAYAFDNATMQSTCGSLVGAMSRAVIHSVLTFTVALLLAFPALLLGGCSCGFDCTNEGDNSAYLTLSLSDSLPEDLSEVVIEIDTITLKRSSGDVVIDTFTIDSVEVDTFQVDLLAYRGVSRLVVLEDYELETGTYSGIELGIIDGDINSSYVLESSSGSAYQLDAVSDFSLSGFTLDSGQQEYVIEFGLAQALSQPGSDSYQISTTGVRVQNVDTAAELSGQVDSSLFDTTSPCDEKTDPESGNRVYLYAAQDLDEQVLADVFTAASDSDPGDATAPFAVATLLENALTGSWEYAFGFLPAGDYTLAFACDTSGDDAINYDALTIPLPAGQVYTFTLEDAEIYTCDIDADRNCL